MSVEALMVQDVVLRVPSGEVRDAIGGSVATYTEVASVMYLEPTHGGGTAFSAGRENMANRNTPIGDWVGYGLTTDPFASDVQIVYDGHTLDVIAPPRLMFNPRTGAASHYELSLQEVDGG